MRIFLPLRHKPIARLWGGLVFSALGDQLYIVALGWVAIGVFGPAAGYLAAGRAGIIMLAVLFGGGLADRWNRRVTMIVADLVRAAALLLVVVGWAMAGAPSGWLLGLAVVVLSLAEGFFNPALQVILPALAPDRDLLMATNGLMDSTDRLARLVGPGMVSMLGTLVAPIHLFGLDAVSFGVSALAVASLVIPAGLVQAPSVRVGLAAGFVSGVRALRRHRPLRFAFDTAWLMNGAWYATFFLAVPLVIAANDSDGAGLGRYGMVIACYGVSNLAGNIWVGSRRMPSLPGRQMLLGTAITGAGMLAVALVGLLPLSASAQGFAIAAASALSGFGGPLRDIPNVALRQMLVGRAGIAGATRAYLVNTYGGMLVAMMLAPIACKVLGPVLVMLICAGAYGGVVAYGVIRGVDD